MTDLALFIAVFLACVVEAVEATTIVVAVGATRSWRSALTGTVAAAAVLVVVVAVLGPAIMLLPLAVLRVVVGGLLLVFGLQWLRKSVLRASGYKALHDEDLIFQRQTRAAGGAVAVSRFGVADWYTFTLAFKGVLLEGLEVVFIVLTFATNQRNLPVAVLAAGVAVVLVAGTGAVVRGPLSRVPENTLKFVVGVMLTSFGAFWGAEGVGALWPGSDGALLVLIPSIAAYCIALTAALRVIRRSRRRAGAHTGAAERSTVASEPIGAGQPPTVAEAGEPATRATATATAAPPRRQNRLVTFGRFWYDFVFGDDWQVALGVILVLAAIGLFGGPVSGWIIAVAGLAVFIPYGTARAARG